MTEPLLLPSGVVVEVAIPGPPRIVMAPPAAPAVMVMPVPGLRGPPGQPGDGAQVIGEEPSGVQDAINTVFALDHTPLTGSIAVYRNGLRELSGVGYSGSGSNITFTTPPLASDVLTVDYLMEG